MRTGVLCGGGTLVIAGALVLGGCAPKRMALPQGPGEPIGDPSAIVREAIGHCESVRTVTAELGLSGRAGRQRLRGRLIAGFADPASVRLEGVAPFGAPVFILAASPEGATLLLPRDRRVLTGAPPSAILEALAGIAIEPDDLRYLLAGCPGRTSVTAARAAGDEWTIADLQDGAVAYFRNTRGSWRLAAVSRPDLSVEYEAASGVQPSRIGLRSAEVRPGAGFDLSLRVSQAEVNGEVPAEAFEVKVPEDALPITLDELRQVGPMRDTAPAPTAS